MAEENSFVFMKYAAKLKERGIFFNRQKVLQEGLPEKLRDLAKSYLGKDIGFLNEDSDIRLYIKDTYGREGLDTFSDPFGTLSIDLERVMLFYHSQKEQKSKQRETYGLTYYMGAVALEKEFALLRKLASKNMIRAEFSISSRFFGWKRCSSVFRRYMLTYGIEEGYDSYVFERESLSQVAFLLSLGMSYEEALGELKGVRNGIFYPNVPLEVENRINHLLFSDELDTSLITGTHSSKVDEVNRGLLDVRQLSNSHNIYCTTVKPIMIDLLGMTLKRMEEDLSVSGFGEQVRVNHLSPLRIGFQVPSGVALQEALPTLAPLLVQVTPTLDTGAFLTGDLL